MSLLFEKPAPLDVREISKALNRPIETLLALARQNDPFFAGCTPASRHSADWFAEQYVAYAFTRGVHLRRIHYVLVSHAVAMADGTPYLNTQECWEKLVSASKPARYLGLVPVDDFSDKRAPEPMIGAPEPTERVEPCVYASCGDALDISLPEALPDTPRIWLDAKEEHYVQFELWCEKSTINDVLEPIAKRFVCNVITGVGELSISACRDLVDRAARNGGVPVRIFYISDFDPAGQSMPVAAARKIEYFVRTTAPNLDVQLNPIALTHDQCVAYRLPRTPIKESERRAGRFEERFGEGATELDALEALHPGELSKIIVAEIRRFLDRDYSRNWHAAASAARRELETIEQEALVNYAQRIIEMQRRLDELRASFEEMASPLKEDIAHLYQDIESEMRSLAGGIVIELPTPTRGDGWDDPLLDSSRGYVDQIDRYKAFQGKPTARRPKNGGSQSPAD